MVGQLEVRGLEFAYPERAPILQGLDLELDSSRLLCVIGPNGAGKSTLLRCIAGLSRPQKGSVSWRGQDVLAMAPKERARSLALVPQGLNRVPEVRVGDFVLGGRYAHSGWLARPQAGDYRAVQAALEEADAAEWSERLLTELSGGERQRVLIARALAQEAELVLVDEPTASLDPEHQLTTFQLLAKLTCAGRAVIIVTHDLNLASQFAMDLALLHQGRLQAHGTPEEVLRAEVLQPVYGRSLVYGELPSASGMTRPFVLPWQVE